MASPFFGTFFDDLNATLRDLELLRQTVRNATSAINSTISENLRTENLTVACKSQITRPAIRNGRDESGPVCVNFDVLCCFFLAAVVIGILIGLRMADADLGMQGEEKEGEKKE